MIEVLKEPGAHYICGRLGKDAAFLLLPPTTSIVIVAFGSIAATY